MRFEDREDAGRQLAHRLQGFAHRADVIVLGIPRGGVPVAFEIASALHLPMDIFLARKLGVPGYEELAFGAVALGGARYLDEQMIEAAGITPEEVQRIAAKVNETVVQRARMYRGGRAPIDVAGRTIILVDDGIATGASIYAAIDALRQLRPASLVVAVPVAPPATCKWLAKVVDELFCLSQPMIFDAVGRFYWKFSPVSDEEVVALLRRAASLSAPRGISWATSPVVD
jgi:putative phosphoribosyl transferase